MKIRARFMELNIQNLYEHFAGLAPFLFATTRYCYGLSVAGLCEFCVVSPPFANLSLPPCL